MGNNTWDNTLDPFPIARGAAVNTFTVLRDVSPTPLPLSYPHELKVGSKVELEAWGEYSTTATPTMRLGFGYGVAAGGAATIGTNVLALSELKATPSGAAAWAWHMHMGYLVTAVGATGTIYGAGILDLGTSLLAIGSAGAASGGPLPITAALRSVTVDTTVQKTWNVLAEFGTSAAGNQVIVDKFTVKIVNQGKTY